MTGQQRREQVTGKVLTMDRRLRETLPYLLALLGDAEATAALAQMDPPLRRQRTFDAITQILLRESLKQPLLLLHRGPALAGPRDRVVAAPV